MSGGRVVDLTCQTRRMSALDRTGADLVASERPSAAPADVGLRRWARSGPALALPGVVALAVLARWGINRDAWLDEALSIAATHQLTETYEQTAYTMATYYAQLTVWTTPSTELWWVRLLSVVHASAAIMVVGTVALRSYGRRVALWGTLFLGCSWIMVRYAHEARSFAFVVLLVSLGWLATDHLVEEPTHRGWIACHVIIGILAPLTHGMAVFSVGWQAVAVLVSGAGRRTWYATVPGWAATVIGTGLLYQAGGSELGTPAESSDLAFIGGFLELFHGGRVLPDPEVAPWLLLLAFTIYGSLLCLQRLVRAPRGRERFRAAMAPAWGFGTLIGILALNTVRPGVHVRYAIGAAPGLALLWAMTAEHLRAWFLARRTRALRLVGGGSLAAMGVLAILLAGQYRYHTTFPVTWTRLVNHIAREARPGDGVAVPNPNRSPFDVAWGRLDDPPELVSVAHVQPLGTLRRFDNYPGASNVHWQVVLTDRLWIVERSVGSGAGGADFQKFMADFVTVHGFEEVDSWEYGEARLHLAVKQDEPSTG